MPTWILGSRDAGVPSQFLHDLHQRLANRVQLTSDGHKAYLEGVDYAWSEMNIDYAQLVKLYGADRPEEALYSPAECIGYGHSIGCSAMKRTSIGFLTERKAGSNAGSRCG